MLENWRDKIYSVVQDGMNRNNTMRQKLSEVQALYKSSKFTKLSKTPTLNVNYGAGTFLLEKYQKEWSNIRSSSEENATLAGQIDKTIADILEVQTKRYVSLTDLSYSLAHLPKITSAVEDCTKILYCIDGLFEEVDKKMAILEDLIDKLELDQKKCEQYTQLARYKEVKLDELEKAHRTMATHSATVAAQKEKEQQKRQEERRLAYQLAFQDDLEAFRRSGNVGTKVERVVRSADNQTSLDQIELDIDTAELDDFLNR